MAEALSSSSFQISGGLTVHLYTRRFIQRLERLPRFTRLIPQ